MDLTKYKGRTQVSYEKYSEFIDWYMKAEHIRVLKIKDKVSSRTVIDKKTKENVAQTLTHGFEVDYLIYDNFYEKWNLNK